MSLMRRILLFVAMLSSVARAGDLSLSAEVDRTTLTMNDTLTLQLTLSGGRGGGAQPQLPAIPGFRATFAGQSQNINYMNGHVSSQVQFTFALAPLSPGEHVIPAISMTVNGHPLSTQPIPVTVLSGAAPDPAGGAVRQDRVANGGRTLFVTTSLDKTVATVGEQRTLLFRFYSRAPLLSQPRYQPPDTTGFLSEDLPPQRQYIATVQGVRYQVIELATALFPTSPGKFTIGPAALECHVQDFQDPLGDGFFQNFFNQGKTLTLRSDPILVTVRPVPEEGRPASFRGDVGNFQISAAFDKNSAQVHDPLTLTVTVSGEGNVKSLSQPPLPVTKEFKTYETLSSLNIDKKDGRLQGSKVFTTVMKPEVSGDLTFPMLSLSFFDPQANAFRTVSTKPLTLRVSPADPAAAPGPGVSFTSGGEGLKEIGRDIRFIKTHGALEPQGLPIQERPWFPYAEVLPGLVFVALWSGRIFGRVGKRRFSPSAGRKALREIKKAQGKEPSTTATLHRIFFDYLAAKVGGNPQGLTPESVAVGLANLGHTPQTLKSVADLWEEFDHARYTPALTPQASSFGVRLAELILSMETK
jgi:hypothetical protein